MKHNRLRSFVAVFILLLVLATGVAVVAQTSPGFNLEWHVIGGGGGVSSSEHYRVEGTAGQGLASPPTSASGSFAVSSGFWYAGTAVYLPVIVSN
jgi:hypothetical protein